MDKIEELFTALDTNIPEPKREMDKPFLMPVEDVFWITGRGTVATGRMERGNVKVGEEVALVGFGAAKKTVVTGVEMFRKLLDEGRAGDNVGLLLRGVEKTEIERGMVLAKPGSITPHTKFDAEVYVLTKEEGGRHTPFFKGYRPQFYFRTTDVTGSVELPAGVEMVMPGDNIADDDRADHADRDGRRAALRPVLRRHALAAPGCPGHRRRPGGGALLWFLPSAGLDVLEPYQRERLIGFVDPDIDPSGSTYNVNQSITAVGAGGLDGRGEANATQTKFNYLPEHSTDFIFSSLAEQRGFLGASILFLLYAVIIWRATKIVSVAKDLFSAILAGTVVFALLIQLFINVGMTIGIAPVTGIPLPLVSYGGSSLLTTLILVGLLEAVHVRGRLAGAR